MQFFCSKKLSFFDRKIIALLTKKNRTKTKTTAAGIEPRSSGYRTPRRRRRTHPTQENTPDTPKHMLYTWQNAARRVQNDT